MAVSPNKLRFVQCGLPDNTAALLAAFLDDFEIDVRDLEATLDDFAVNDAPGILAALDEQVAIRKTLIEGGRVPELATFEGLEENLKFISPERGEDAVAVSLDERKLGAVGIVCLNGKIFAKLAGDDLQAFRQLWFAVGGDYDSFITLGDGVAATLDGEVIAVQYNPKSDLFPYINRTWRDLDSLQPFAKRSNYKQAFIWKERIVGNSANNNRLRALGVPDSQIQNMFARRQPQSQDVTGFLTLSNASMKELASLLLLPTSSQERKPAWTNEANAVEAALRAYLQYRFETGKSSYIFKTDMWERLKALLSEKDMKELFENRPEVTNMLLPTDEATLSDLLTAATNFPIGTAVINTYMLSLPNQTKDAEFEKQLLRTGSRVYVRMQQVLHTRAPTIKALLEELNGAALGATEFNSTPPNVNINDVLEVEDIGLDPTVEENPPPSLDIEESATDDDWEKLKPEQLEAAELASIKQAIGSSEDSALSEQSVATSKVGDDALKEKERKATAGFETRESFATILLRRMRWSENFLVCGKTFSKEVTGFVPITEGTNTVGGVVGAASTGPAAGGATDASDLSTLGSEITDNYNERVKAANKNALRTRDRRTISPAKPPPRRSIDINFGYKCEPAIKNRFKEITVPPGLTKILNLLKELVFQIQELIDTVILKIQVTLDVILARLERLLTFDFHVGGALGFENSLMKCSFNIDFGIKIDLFGILLTLLNQLFDLIGKPLRKALQAIQDFLNKIICVPVRLLEALLGGVNSLLGLIGCALKDIRLPDEILEILQFFLLSLDLRGLVLRKGYEGVQQLSFGLRKHRRSFNGLTQFAALCQKVTMRDALNEIDGTLLKTVVTAPTVATDKLKASSEILKQKGIAQTANITDLV